ncbi:MAG: hypothetical protein ACPGNT_01660 [Rhodospirillales bacterium]
MTIADVRMLLALSPGDQGRALEAAARDRGIRKLIVVESARDLIRATKDINFDLIVSDFDLPDGSAGPTLHALRHGRHGVNPFSVVITLINDAAQDKLRSVVDTGTDAVLIAPCSPQQLVDRITVLGEARKPFVVTADYIGPDRRSGPPRAGSMEIRKLSVPNPLRLALTGQADAIALGRAIETAKLEVNTERVARCAFQLCFLGERVMPRLQRGLLDNDLRASLERMTLVGDDMLKRLPGTQLNHEINKCLSLHNMTLRVKESLPVPDSEDIRLLGKSLEVMAASFKVVIPDALRQKIALPMDAAMPAQRPAMAARV